MINKKIIYKNKDIKIYETTNLANNIRILKQNNAIYSISYIENKNKLPNQYLYFYNIPLQINSNIKNTLMLGAAGFAYPKYYISKYKDKCMDAIEINNQLIELSFKYFYLNDLYNEFDKKRKRLRIYCEDALNYVKKCKKKYDYIFQDIFEEKEPIDIFLQNDFIENITHILSKKGIFSCNYIINKGKEEKIRNYLINLKYKFKYIEILTINDERYYSNGYGNIYIMCSNKKIEIKINKSIVKKLNII